MWCQTSSNSSASRFILQSVRDLPQKLDLDAEVVDFRVAVCVAGKILLLALRSQLV